MAALNVDEAKLEEVGTALLKASSSIAEEALSETAKTLGGMRGTNDMVDETIDELLKFEAAYNSVFKPSIVAVLKEMDNIAEFKNALAKATSSMTAVKLVAEEVHVNSVELPTGL